MPSYWRPKRQTTVDIECIDTMGESAEGAVDVEPISDELRGKNVVRYGLYFFYFFSKSQLNVLQHVYLV